MIIYKNKNRNNKYQYFIYLFLGYVTDDIKTILFKFKDLSLPETLEKLNKQEYINLSSFFNTDQWFNKFFNKHHINHFLKTSKDLKKYEDKFGITFKQNKILFNHKFTYGFDVYHKNTIHERISKKIYTEHHNQVLPFNEVDEDILLGGKKEKADNENAKEDNEETIEDDFDKFLNNESNDNITNNNDDISDFVENDEVNEQNMDLVDDIDDAIFNNEDLKNSIKLENKNIKEVNDLMSKKEISSIISFIDFDKSKMNSIYNEELKNCYNKNYIFNQEIKKSDTIQEIKEKIFYTIKNNDSYGQFNYLEPSRLYLWSEYLHNSKYVPYQIEKEIIKNNKLLDFPVEPIDIDNYLNLSGNIKKVYDQLNNFKINNITVNDKRNYILSDRYDYIDNDEIYVIDIYNEIGSLYSSIIQQQQLQNFYKTFMFLYFDQVQYSDLNNILAYISSSNSNIPINEEDKKLKKNEEEYIKLKFNLGYSNFILKSWIDQILSSTYIKKNNEVKKILTNTCITRIQLKLNLHNKNKEINNIDTFTIFNELNANNRLLFIQYTKLNGTTLYKFDEKELKSYINKIFKGAIQTNLEQVVKWFNIAQPGLIFKYQFEEGKRPLHIYIDNFGRLNFDIYANCENHFHYSDLKKYKDIIRSLVSEINNTNITYPFILPEDDDYSVRFVNAICDIDLGDKINYNDLSDFVSLFYPYFANIIEPKRKKLNSNEYYGRSGIYLRYKKISEYNTKNKIIKTIWKYRKYYDATESEIVNQICKEFNISKEDGSKLFDESIKIRPSIKQVKQLKKITNKTRIKSEGISIELQHREDTYVIKYHGLRNEQQDNDITKLLLTILYLYIEIYQKKNKKYFYIKDKIKDIKTIAKRKFDILNYLGPEELVGIKAVQNQDKDRLKFKANKYKNVWSRLCQNSGKLRRQPKIFNNIDALIQYGYKMNKSSGYYERQVKDKKTGKMVTLKAVNLSESGESPVYYTCNPEINGNQMYIGILNKLNPDGKALPCCFINNKLEKQMKNYKKKLENIKDNKDSYNTNYILQNTRYTPIDRLQFLPPILNYYFNDLKNNKYVEKQHILKSVEPEYYFIVGTSDDNIIKSNNNFLFTVAHALGLTLSDLVFKIIKNLNDTNFNALNNGMLKLIYKNKEKYIKKLEEVKKTKLCTLKTEDLNHVLTIPGIVKANGLNIIIIEKVNQDYKINYVNNEEIDYIDDVNRLNIILFYNGFEYSIISKVYKNEDDLSHINKTEFKGDDDVIMYFKNFYKLNINISSGIYGNLIAKKIFKTLKNKKYKIKQQVINTLNKTIYFIIEDSGRSFLIPTVPSGSIFNIPLTYIDGDEYNKSINDYQTIMDNEKIYKDLDLQFIGFYYYRIKNDQYYCRELIWSNSKYNIGLPIKKYKIPVKDKDKNKIYFYKQYYKNIDDIIKKYPNIEYDPDNRVRYIEYENYKTTAYQYFRSSLSHILLKNQEIREKLINIVESKPEDIKEIRRLIYSLIDNHQLHKFYKKMTNESVDDKTKNKFTIRIYNKPEIENKIKNYNFEQNNIIKDYSNSKKCNNIMYSLDKDNKCIFSLTFDLLVDFINHVCYELLNYGIKCFEILNLNGYYVSSVINTNIYRIKEGQKVIKKHVETKNNVFIDYLKENPQDVNDFDPNDEEKYKNYYKLSNKYKKQEEKTNKIIELNQGKRIKNFIYQPVYDLNDSYLRAYVNCLFWISNHNIKDNQPTSIKNLGYYNTDQDKIINYVKSQLIDNIIFNDVTKDEIKDKDELKDDKKLIDKVSKNTNMMRYQDIIKITNRLYDIFKHPVLILDSYNKINYTFPKSLNVKNEENTINLEEYAEKINKGGLSDYIIIKIENFENKKIIAVYSLS